MRAVENLPREMERLLGWLPGTVQGAAPDAPRLREQDGILALHFNDGSIQSEMSIDDPDALIIPYTRDVMGFLLFKPAPARIAMIGLGGGSLAKYCYRHLPQAEITVVEINPDVIALRHEFAVPADDARFKVLRGDGAEFVKEATDRYDVLIVDGFDAQGLPPQLSSQWFYDDCSALLADEGLMVVNLWCGHTHYDDCLVRIGNSFAGCVAVVDADDGLNRIVFAVKSAAFPPSAATIRRHARLLGSAHALNFQAKANKLIRSLTAREVDSA